MKKFKIAEDLKMLRKIKKEICKKEVPLCNDDRLDANGEPAGDFGLRYVAYLLNKRVQKLENKKKKKLQDT